MSIITISSYSGRMSEQVGTKVARSLEYRIITEDDLVSDTSESYGILREDLAKTFSDSPSIRKSTLEKRKQLLAYLQAKLAHLLLDDNIVYTGPIGHLLIQGISHVLRVFLIETTENQIKRVMEDEQLPQAKAEKMVARRIKNHHRWVKNTLGVDDPDYSSFDLMIQLDSIDLEAACGLIVDTVRTKKFQAMTYSRNLMKDKELTCRIRASLVELDPDIRVRSKNGEVTVITKALGKAREKKRKIIAERVSSIEGVRGLNVEVRDDLFGRLERGRR